MTSFRASLVASLLLASLSVYASDAAVKDASEGFRFGDLRRVNAAVPQTRGNVLEGYVDYWSLRLQFDNASTGADIERFLQKHAGEFVADRLRVDWLKQLAKTGNWDGFAQLARGFDTDDGEIACHRVTLAAKSDAKELLPVPRGVWEERLTEACADAFSALARQNLVTADDALWRFRTTADGGTFLAGARVAEGLSADNRPSTEALQRAHASPESYLNAGLAWSSRAHRQAGLYALTKLARSDVAIARSAWSGIRAKITEEEQRYAAGQLAYASARRLDRKSVV